MIKRDKNDQGKDASVATGSEMSEFDKVVRIRQAQNQVSCGLDDEMVILHLENSLYYGTDRVGACIWEALREPMRFDDICCAVLERFDVDEDRCRAEVTVFLGKLMAAGLIDVVK